MSMFSVLGLILAFPAAGIIRKIGLKAIFILTGVMLLIGSGLGALAPNYQILLVSRVIEGFGAGVMSVAAPSALAAIIPDKSRGLAFGIQGVTFPVGTVIGLNAAPAIVAATGSWQAVWIGGAILGLVVAVLVALFFKLPPEDNKLMAHKSEGGGQAAAALAAAKPLWIGVIAVSVVYLIWQLLWVGAFNSFYPTFLQASFEMSQQEASFMTSLTNFIIIITGPLSGIVLDKVKSRKWLLVVAMTGSAVLFAVGWFANMGLVWLFIIGESIFAPCVLTAVMAATPDLVRDPTKVGLGMACVNFFKCIGMIIGSAAFAPVQIALDSYSMASLAVLVPLALIAAVITIIFVKDTRSKKNEPAEA
jgi:MFS family permease